MAIEALMQSVLAASPAMRRKLEAVIQGRDTQMTSDNVDAKLCTITGAAKAMCVCRNTVLSLIKTNRLKIVDLNGHRRVTWQSIREFLDGEHPANEQTAEIVQAHKAAYAASKAAKEAK